MRAIFLAAWLLCSSAHAATVGLEFKSVSVADLAESVVRGVLKRDYVMAPEVMSNGSKLSVSITAIEPDKVFETVRNVCRSAGVDLIDRDGVIYFQKLGAEPAAPMSPVQQINQQPNQSPPGQHGQQFNAMIKPDEMAYHRPSSLTVDFLASVARVAGAVVPHDMRGGDQKRPDVLVFGGDAATVEKVKKLLLEIDRPASSLVVRAALVEFSDASNGNRSFSLALQALGGRLGVNLSAGSIAANNIAITGANLQAALTAIEGDRRFTYRAEPLLKVMDGETARFVAGQDVPTRGAISQDKNGTSYQSIEYRTAGVVVTVTPKIVRDGIVVKVGQQVSSFAATTTSGIDSPTILKREAETTVAIADGELIAIAGMDETRESDASEGISFLPNWMRGSSHEKSRSQLMLLLEVKRI